MWLAYGDSLAQGLNETLGVPRALRELISISGHGLESNNLGAPADIPAGNPVIFSTGWNDPMAGGGEGAARQAQFKARLVQRLLEVNDRAGGQPIVVMGLEERAGHGERDLSRVTETNRILNEAIAEATQIAQSQGKPVRMLYLDLQNNPMGPDHSADFRSHSDGLHYNSKGCNIIYQRAVDLAGGVITPQVTVGPLPPVPPTPPQDNTGTGTVPSAPPGMSNSMITFLPVDSRTGDAEVNLRNRHIVRAIQAALHVKVDGIAGSETLSAWTLYEHKIHTDGQGVDGKMSLNEVGLLLGAPAVQDDQAIVRDKDLVKKIQQKLNETYHCNLVVDGLFGPKTSAAWHQFEQANNGTTKDELASRAEIDVLLKLPTPTTPQTTRDRGSR